MLTNRPVTSNAMGFGTTSSGLFYKQSAWRAKATLTSSSDLIEKRSMSGGNLEGGGRRGKDGRCPFPTNKLAW